MKNRLLRVLVIAAALLGLSTLTACDLFGDDDVPPNTVSISISSNNTINMGKPVFVTDKPSLKIRIYFNAGSVKKVNVINLTREDMSAEMNLGDVIDLTSTTNFDAYMDVTLPRGTYGIVINDVTVPGGNITVCGAKPNNTGTATPSSSSSLSPTATAPITPNCA